MLTLTRRSSTIARFAAASAVAAGLTLGGAVLQPAAAGGGCGINLGCGGSSTPSTPTTSGHTVTVTVSGSFVGGGSDGSPGGGTTSVSVPSPCWYDQGFSGAEYADYVDSGQQAASEHHHGDVQEPTYPGYEKHKKDQDGHWYGGACSSETFGDDLDGFFKYADKWFAGHKTIWVPGGQQPPTPPVPPEILLMAAQKALTLPEPTFDYNPKENGAASLVNLDTWFWLDKDIDTGDVTASAGGNSVTVTATRESVSFTAPTAGSVSCADGGTEWSNGASSNCVLYFRQASAGTPVTSTARWGLSWTANGAPRGNLPGITASQTDDVKVIEVQSVVNGAS